MHILRSFEDLPRFGAALAGLSYLAFGFAAIFSVSGRTGVTDGLEYFAVPMVAAGFAAAGYGAGLVVLWSLSENAPLPVVSQTTKVVLSVVLIAAIVSSAAIGMRFAEVMSGKAQIDATAGGAQ
jgi:hypothetical protein